MAFKEFQNFNLQVVQYAQPGWYDVPRGCNGWTVTNTGDTNATVNDMPLYPGTPGTSLGDSRTVGGNAGEIFIGQIKLTFAVPAGVNPLVEIAFKVYVP